jgi:hypothetical protein
VGRVGSTPLRREHPCCQPQSGTGHLPVAATSHLAQALGPRPGARQAAPRLGQCPSQAARRSARPLAACWGPTVVVEQLSPLHPPLHLPPL